MEEPDFWDVPEKAQEQMKELGDLKEDRDTFKKLETAKEDMEYILMETVQVVENLSL